MVKFISKLGGLFGKDPKKSATKPAKTDPRPKKAKNSRSAVPKKPVKQSKRAAKAKPAKAASTKPTGHAAAKPVALPKPKPGRELRTVVLFVMPDCADCEEARKLLNAVRRVVRNVVFQEVDLSTKEGELEGLLNGIVKAPAFVINGRPVFRGVLPSREQLARVINEAPSQ